MKNGPNNAIDPIKNLNPLKLVFATRIGSVGIIAVVGVLLFILADIVHVSLSFQAISTKSLALLITPTLEKAIDTQDAQSDKVDIAAVLAKFSELDFVSYVDFIDASGKSVASWTRDKGDNSFSYRHARHVLSGDYDFTSHGMYSKFQIKDHKLIVGTSIAERLWENLARFSGIYFLITIIVATLVCLLFVVFNKRILTPLINLNRNANKILADNDLTTPLPIEAQSQIGQITKCINLIIARLRNMLLDLRETCNKFADITASLQAAGSDITANATAIRTDITTTKETMNELNNSFGSVAAKLQELNAQSERGSTTVYQMGQVNQEVFENVTSMSASVSQSIAAIAQMSEAIQETATHVAQLNSDIGSVDVAMQRLSSSITMEENSSKDSLILAKELAVNADAGMQALKKTIDGIALMQKSSDDTAAVIRTLGNHAMDIGNILHVIDDVTKQTGLLALNAAIISAQAGEHGRGFAVVADEIGALATRTKESTKEIAELIMTIQNESKKAVAVMEENITTIEHGAKLGAEAEAAFNKLKASADKSTKQAENLASATNEQASDVEAVNQAISGITGTLEAINAAAKRQAEEAEAMNSAAGKMNLLNQQVARSSEEQARSAKDVLKAIQNISGMSAAVSESQNMQIESTGEVVLAVDSVDKNAAMQGQAAGRLVAIIEAINKQLKRLSEFTTEFKI